MGVDGIFVLEVLISGGGVDDLPSLVVFEEVVFLSFTLPEILVLLCMLFNISIKFRV